MVKFNANTYDIYWYKNQDKATPFSPESPTASIGTSPQNKNALFKDGALIAMGLTVAKRTVDTVRSEIGSSTGNEVLQTDINNAMKGIGYLGAIAADGIIGGGLVVIDAVQKTIIYAREISRTNRKSSLDRKLQGKRALIASGSAYYG